MPLRGILTSASERVRKDAAAAVPCFRVKTTIDNASGRLLSGMTGLAKIDCGMRPAWTVVLRRLARYLRVEFWSWW